jgi:hypothetical protein
MRVRMRVRVVARRVVVAGLLQAERRIKVKRGRGPCDRRRPRLLRRHTGSGGRRRDRMRICGLGSVCCCGGFLLVVDDGRAVGAALLPIEVLVVLNSKR